MFNLERDTLVVDVGVGGGGGGEDVEKQIIFFQSIRFHKRTIYCV